jgi:hypothetical protein
VAERRVRVTRRMQGAAPGGWVILVIATLAAGCASASSAARGGDYGGATSEMAVRSFLDGAGVKDYGRMMRLFGTADGPAVDRHGVTNVERRMIVLAGLLQHESYDLRQANLAQLGPDRVRWEVTLAGTRRGTVVVPVVTVPDRSGRWYVEVLNLDALTASAGS